MPAGGNVLSNLRDVKNAGQWALPYLGAAVASAPAYAIGAAKYGVPEIVRGYQQGGIMGALGGLNEAARRVPYIGNASVDLMDAATQYAEEQGAPAAAMFAIDMLAPDPTGKIGALASGAAAAAKGLGGLNLAVIPAFVGSPQRWSMNPELGRLTTRLDKAFTGEGAQVEGIGNYSAEIEDTAAKYRDQRGKTNEIRVGGEIVDVANRSGLTDQQIALRGLMNEIERADYDVDAGADVYLRRFDKDIEFAETSSSFDGREAERAKIIERLKAQKQHAMDALDDGVEIERGNAIYGVLHDVNEEDLLDLDLPLSQQPPAVLEKVLKAFPQYADGAPRGRVGQLGADHYNANYYRAVDVNGQVVGDYPTRAEAEEALARTAPTLDQLTGRDLVKDTLGRPSRVGMEKLRDAGIPGSQYLDQLSRGKKGVHGSHNYVMFSDDLTYVDPSRTDPDLIGDMPVGAPYRTVGGPTRVYHSTDADFDAFDPRRSEIGFHFAASPELATNAAIKGGRLPSNLTSREYDLDTKGFVEIAGQGNGFTAFRLIEDLADRGFIDNDRFGELMDRYEAIEDELATDPEEFALAVNRLMRDAVEPLGIKGFYYDNQFDSGLNLLGTGQDVQPGRSYIALTPDQPVAVEPAPSTSSLFIPRDNAQIETLAGAPQPALPRIATHFSGTGTVEGAIGPHESISAVEYDAGIVGNYNEAHGTNYEPRSVFDVDPSEVEGADLYHASPVCKNLSCAKRGREIDTFDQKSADKVVEVISAAKPPAVTIENVPGYEKTVLFDEILDALDNEGYAVDVQIVNPADYGGAQHRPRLLIRASLDGPLPALPEKSGPSDWYALVEDLIDDAPDMPFKGRGGNESWEVRRLRKDIDDGLLDPSQPIITMGGSASKGRAYAANAGGAAPTLTSTAASVPRIMMPDGRVKRVTGRMMARLMGLPDSFKIPDNWGQAKKVLGNGIHGEMTRKFIQPMAEAGRRASRGE
jgi:site-specific DNA-cytosine methylase